MKFHRVLLFTSIQMDITPVGEDLHILLTNDGLPCIGATAWACPVAGTDPVETEITLISSDEDPEKFFTIYVADRMSKETGKKVLCTGGIYIENPDDRQMDKLYENIDEMIQDWTNFLSD